MSTIKPGARDGIRLVLWYLALLLAMVLAALATVVALQQGTINCEKARRCPNKAELKREQQELQQFRQKQRKMQQELNQLKNLIKPPLPPHIGP